MHSTITMHVRPNRQTDGRTDEHYGNSATNALRAKTLSHLVNVYLITKNHLILYSAVASDGYI